MDSRDLRLNVEEQLVSLRKSYKFFKENKGIDGRIQHMITIKGIAAELKQQLATIPVVPTLFEAANENEERLTDTLQLMIINLVEYYKTSEIMGKDMIYEIALRIVLTFGGLTLEDIALCFHQAKSGQIGNGKIYNRIDGGVIMEWLNHYQANVQFIGMERNRRLHNQGKTGIWKDGHEYRILQPKRVKELM